MPYDLLGIYSNPRNAAAGIAAAGLFRSECPSDPLLDPIQPSQTGWIIPRYPEDTMRCSDSPRIKLQIFASFRGTTI